MTAGPPPDTGIDAAILDRMTDTLIILQPSPPPPTAAR